MSFTPPRDGIGKRAYELMLELAAIESVTGSEEGENSCVRFIHEWFSRLGYFRNNPQNLRLTALENDSLNRCFVSALVRSPRGAKRTVVLAGHVDVVDTDVCGPLRPWAFDPAEYTKRIGELNLPADAREDLASGRYLFGRGVSDMKTGLALNMCLLEHYAAQAAQKEPDSLDFNVLFLAVPDEEGDSAGMRGAVPLLAQWKEEGLDFLACINTEPTFISGVPAVYYGTIGKIMPLYLCVGRESHVGEYYEGLNSTLVASYLNISLDGSGDTRESLGTQTFPPQCCLRVRDTRDRYAVTLPERTVLYYNCLTVEKTPAAILEDMKARAAEAMRAALSHIGRTDWTPRVLTVEDILNRAAEAAGGREKLFAELEPSVTASDERERNIEFLCGALDRTGEKGPLVVVGFVPPFYPSRLNRGERLHDRAVRYAASAVKEELKSRGIDNFAEREIFQGITDMSFTGFQKDAEEIAPLAANTPLWGRGYELPLAALQKIDIPCAILGPIGKDAHKITERVELEYSFNVLPLVLRNFIESLLEYFQKNGGSDV